MEIPRTKIQEPNKSQISKSKTYWVRNQPQRHRVHRGLHRVNIISTTLTSVFKLRVLCTSVVGFGERSYPIPNEGVVPRVNSYHLYENILEKHKRWKIFLIAVLILSILIMVIGTIAGFIAQDIANEQDLADSKEISWIPLTYFIGSFMLCGSLTFIAFLLYEKHIKKIPEIRDENIKDIIQFYLIFFIVFFLSFYILYWFALCFMPFVFLIVTIITNVKLIFHSRKIERAIEEIYKVRSYHAHQASSIHHQLESDRKYCSTCQYPLIYEKNSDRYYCEVCKKYEK